MTKWTNARLNWQKLWPVRNRWVWGWYWNLLDLFPRQQKWSVPSQIVDIWRRRVFLWKTEGNYNGALYTDTKLTMPREHWIILLDHHYGDRTGRGWRRHDSLRDALCWGTNLPETGTSDPRFWITMVTQQYSRARGLPAQSEDDNEWWTGFIKPVARNVLCSTNKPPRDKHRWPQQCRFRALDHASGSPW